MDIEKLIKTIERPEIYEKGDSVMWTDKHISSKLLEIHLNPEIDGATRKQESINRTIDFLLKLCSKKKMKILDLGCGPGIYCEKFAEQDHSVTGIDFSSNTIEYARNKSKDKTLKIKYLCKDYLDLDYKEEFDIIILIYTDFGVLLPNERTRLLNNIHNALKPGGLFIFDVLNTKNIDQKFSEQRDWKFERDGFWSPKRYLALSSGFYYETERVFLKQHTIIDETYKIQNYRFWVHAFSYNEIKKILKDNFCNIQKFENILPEHDIWSGENVTFYKAEKKKQKNICL